MRVLFYMFFLLGVLSIHSSGQDVLPVGCDGILSPDERGTGSWVLDQEGLAAANNNFQRVVECTPVGASLILALPSVELDATVELPSSISISGGRKGGKKVVLRCSGNQPLFDISGEKVEISNIKLTDCNLSSLKAPFHIRGQSETSLENVKCSDNVNTLGSACISVDSGQVHVMDGIFQSNKGSNGGVVHAKEDSVMTVANSKFIDNSADLNGGALNLEDSTVNISDTLFLRNIANGDGGAIIAQGRNAGLTLTIWESVLRKNSAGNREQKSNGGALMITGSKTSVNVEENVTFEGNSASQDGGAIYGQEFSNLVMKKGKAVDNHADTGVGSAVCLEGLGEFIADGMQFERNSGRGAAVFIQAVAADESTVRIQGTEFKMNHGAGINGGGLALVGVMQVSLLRSRFDENVAGQGGAMLVLNSITINATDCEFISNHAMESGGALHAAEGASQIHFSATKFMNNTAGPDQSVASVGGALALWGPFLTLDLSRDVIFQGNSAGSGGAVHMDFVQEGNVKEVEFNDNNATTGVGGAMENVDVEELSINDIVFKRNEGRGGGAVSIQVMHIRESKTRITGVEFVENHANVNAGGAIRLQGRGELAVKSSKFDFNSAVDGGAITAADFSELSVAKCTFDANNALQRGGALLAMTPGKWQANVSILDSDFTKNSATSKGPVAASVGGAIYLHGSALSTRISGSVKFVENAASFDGGAVWSSGGELEVVDAVFTRNEAQEGAGGACTVERMHSVFESVRFEKNKASKGGALVLRGQHSDRFKCTISKESVFLRNHAVVVGRNDTEAMAGAVYIVGGLHATLTGAKFLMNNAAEGVGGAIVAEGSARLVLDSTTFRANSALRMGSILVTGENSKCFIRKSSEFRNNTARDAGGAVGASKGALLSLQDVSMISNTVSEGCGGAIDMKGNSTLKIRESHFVNNTATFGGAVAIVQEQGPESSMIRIDNATFEGNIAHTKEGIPPGLSPEGADVNGSGGAIFMSGLVKTSLSNINFLFNKAARGGAVYASGVIEGMLHDCNFSKNHAAQEGGGFFLFMYSTQDEALSDALSVSLVRPTFWRNSAGDVDNYEGKLRLAPSGEGGAIFAKGSRTACVIHGAVFHENNAADGGGINWRGGSNLEVSSGEFTGNTATLGGAMHMKLDENEGSDALVSISDMLFERNLALSASVILVETTQAPFDALEDVDERHPAHLDLVNVTVSNNKALGSCGGISLSQTLLKIRGSTFTGNSASSGATVEAHGGCMCLRELSWADVEDSEFADNKAYSGGAVYVHNSILHTKNATFSGNQADEGGAVAQFYESVGVPTQSALSQYNSSTFRNNSARFGGALYINFARLVNISCEDFGLSSFNSPPDIRDEEIIKFLRSCQSSVRSKVREVAIVASRFIGNSAQSGSVVFTNDPYRVHICCGKACPDRSAEKQELPDKFPCQEPRVGGEVVLWSQEVGTASVIATSSVLLTVSPPILDNHTSGEELKTFVVSLEDTFGQNAISESFSLTVKVKGPPSLQEAISGSAVTGVVVTGGTANVSGIRLQGSPGSYTLLLSAKAQSGKELEAELEVNVRECRVGEVSAGEICFLCRDNFFSFNSSGECLPCPEDAVCNGSTLVPLDGYWQPSSRSSDLSSCVWKHACSFIKGGVTRQEILLKEQQAAALHGDELHFSELSLCDLGYEGIRCGSCEPGYGKKGSQECVKCGEKGWGVVGLIAMTGWLWLLAALLIRKSLTWALNMPVGTEGAGELDNVDYESSKSRASEIAKIIINFFQTTGIAWGLDTNWSSSVSKLLAGLDTASGIAYSSVSSIACMFGSTRPTRSLLSIVIPMYIPLLAWIIFCLFWSVVAMVRRMGVGDFITRSIISMLALLFVYFIGTAKRVARLFYCITVGFLPEGDSAKIWAEDTRFTCFEGDHLKMMFVGAPMGIATCVIFPLWIIIHLRRNKHRFKNRDFIKRYGFLYKSYRSNAEFWEVVILARKALLAGIVVNSEPLGVDLQATLCVGVLILALIVHALIHPFKKRLSRLNTLEFTSLTISTFIFLSGPIFNSEKTTDIAKILLSIGLFGGIIIFSIILIIEMLFAGVKVLILWAEAHGLIDQNVGASENFAKAVEALKAHILGLGPQRESPLSLEAYNDSLH